jgi:hypothetical protein
VLCISYTQPLLPQHIPRNPFVYAPFFPRVYQLAFLTPGSSPASAFNLNWNLHIRKSRKTPLPFPAMMHRFLICVGRVWACIELSSSCAFNRCNCVSCVFRVMNLNGGD